MRPRISIRGFVRPSVGPSVTPFHFPLKSKLFMSCEASWDIGYHYHHRKTHNAYRITQNAEDASLAYSASEINPISNYQIITLLLLNGF